MIKDIYKFLSSHYQNLFLDYRVDLKPRYGHGAPPHKQLYEIVNKQREDFKLMLNEVLNYSDYLLKIKDATAEKDNTKPTWNNGYLPGLDIVMLYTLITHLRPAKYVEIGSGNSTKVAYKAKNEHEIPMEIISVDPQPRAEIDTLSQKIIRQPFENTDYSFLFKLQPNDIVFVDNSHRVLPNSDAMVFFMEVLPLLPKGVYVHVHDIYIPYDYPEFMCQRAYSEQYALAAFLLSNPQRYKTISPNYFISEDAELSAILTPLWQNQNLKNVEKHGGSYWILIC